MILVRMLKFVAYLKKLGDERKNDDQWISKSFDIHRLGSSPNSWSFHYVEKMKDLTKDTHDGLKN